MFIARKTVVLSDDHRQLFPDRLSAQRYRIYDIVRRHLPIGRVRGHVQRTVAHHHPVGARHIDEQAEVGAVEARRIFQVELIDISGIGNAHVHHAVIRRKVIDIYVRFREHDHLRSSLPVGQVIDDHLPNVGNVKPPAGHFHALGPRKVTVGRNKNPGHGIRKTHNIALAFGIQRIQFIGTEIRNKQRVPVERNTFAKAQPLGIGLSLRTSRKHCGKHNNGQQFFHIIRSYLVF